MRIDSIEILNYQGFSDVSVQLDPGFNLVVGRNNTGKSALLRALTLRANGSPHMSLSSVPRRGDIVNPNSMFRMQFSASGEEVHAAVFSERKAWAIPAPTEPELILDRWEKLRASSLVSFHCSMSVGKDAGRTWSATKYPAMRAYETLGPPDEPKVIQIVPDYEWNAVRHITGPTAVQNDGDSGVAIGERIAGGIYKFDAERLHLAKYNFGTVNVLAPDASNLPEVLSTLRSIPVRYRTYVGLVSEVFPSITDVTLQSRPNNQVEIMIWQTPPELERDDLAVSLESCGTGVGQVLAILYVVKTSDTPRTILIDEPNSFLHPGAARALIRILKRFSQHQYVIATHSPEVISEVGPARVINLRFVVGQSVVEQFDKLSVDTAAGILGDLGARLSDVLGYELVVWVEGPSDADAFMLISQRVATHALTSAFLPVRSTAAFEGVDLREVLHLHRQLSERRAPMPPIVRFVFDREGRSEQTIRELQHESDGAMHFLSRRMLENYLLDAAALSARINNLDADRTDPVSEEAVAAWIRERGTEKQYLATAFQPGGGDWLHKVHGAKLVNDLMGALTEMRLEYRKTRDAPWLVEWLLTHRPEQLADLEQIVREVLDVESPGELRSARSQTGAS